MLTVGKLINISSKLSSYAVDNEESRNNINLHWLPMQFSSLLNNRFSAGSKMRLITQEPVSIIYCSKLEETRVFKNQLDRFLTLLENRIWIALTTLVTY